MRFFFWQFICLITFFQFLNAQPPPAADETPDSIATLEGLPSSVVNHVSVITGEYTDHVSDVVLPGPETLSLSRSYSSGELFGNYGGGWNSNHVDSIRYRRGKIKDKSYWICNLKQPSGAALSYTTPDIKENKHKPIVGFKLYTPKGLSNGSGGEISGRTNLKNQKVRYYPPTNSFECTSGSGDKQTFTYRFHDERYNIYSQDQETKVNGSSYKYESWSDMPGGLKSIQCFNSANQNLFSRIDLTKIHQIGNSLTLRLTTSDDRSIIYKYFSQKFKESTNYAEAKCKIFYLKEVESAHKPQEKYEYTSRESYKKGLQLKSKTLPNNRFTNISYYKKGDNHLGGGLDDISIDSGSDYRLDRVRLLYAPAGTTEKPIVVNRFVYKINKKTKENHTEYLDGYTSVYDAHRHLTKYYFNKEHRLIEIKKYSGNGEYKRYVSENFVWGKQHSSDEGNLIGKYLADATGKIYSYSYNKYDDNGNIIENSLYGNLTGKQDTFIRLDDHHIPIKNCCEKESKTCSYTNDGLNLLKEEIDSNGTKTMYRYRPGSNLIIARYLTTEEGMQRREFFEYDENNVVCQKILDDGKAIDAKKMIGVTERHITRYKTRKAMPVGLIERQDNYCLDLASNQEVLLGSITYEYTKEGHVTKKDHYDSQGSYRFSEEWEYDAHGNVITEINPLGEVIQKRYDANDNLIYQQGPHPDYYIENTYDFMNRLIKQEEIHANGQRFVTSHTYNTLGNCKSTINPYGHETNYDYDAFGRVTCIYSPGLANEEGIVVRPIVSKQYNIAGFPTCTTDPLGREVHVEYNIRGQPTHIVFPDATEEFYYYRLDGQLEKKVEKNGVYTVYKRDYQGRVLSETTKNKAKVILKQKKWTYNSFQVLSYEDPEGIVANYEYDYAGRLVKTQKDKRIEEYTYDCLGRLAITKEWLSDSNYRLIKKDYDFLDRVIEEKIESPVGQVLAYNRYQYDCMGNQILIQNGDNITYTEYNSQGNPILTINSLGHKTHVDYNYNYLNEHQQYVLQTITTDALGNQTFDTYDPANRLVETTKKNAFGIELANQKIFYDLCGNRVKVIDKVMAENNQIRESVTQFRYTADNQVKEVIEAAGTPDKKITDYAYNQWGQKSIKIKPDGIKLFYEYDQEGHLKTVKSSDEKLFYTYAYNKNDQITEIRDEIHQLHTYRYYDSLGELKSERLGHGLLLSYEYDYAGQLTRLILPDQSRVEYEYNAVNLTAVRRIKDQEVIYSHIDQNHNLAGYATRCQLAGNNKSIDYTFDSLGRCLKIEHAALFQTVPTNGYDAVGNLLNYQSQGIDYNFEYDDLYQIKKEDGHVTHNYQHDSLSNRLLKNGEVYTVNTLNQLTQKGEDTYLYDPNGNLIQKQSKEDLTTYSYDALDRLIKVCKNGQEISYSYDGFNRRLSKQQGDQIKQHFIYAGQEEIGAIENERITELKVISKGNRSPAIALEFEDYFYVPIYDIFGHVVCLNDSEGRVVERYRYTAFGETEIFDNEGNELTESIVGNPWQYANRRYDAETGLVAFGLRYYDPQSGRWITPDPTGFDDGPNLYAYVHSNPLIYLDQYGLFTFNLASNFMQCPPVNFAFTMMNYLNRDILSSAITHCDYNFNMPAEPPTADNYDMYLHRDSFGDDGVYSINNDFVHPHTGEDFQFRNDPNIAVTWMHGIGNNMEDFSSSLWHFSRISGMDVKGVFDKTQGLFKDFWHFYNAHYKCISYNPSRMLQSAWYAEFARLPKDGIIIHYCHSRGAVYTRNALMDFPEELRARIHIIAIAPGGIIPPDLCGSVVHLCSKRDFVPAADLKLAIKHRNTIVFLDPAPGAGFHDHTVMSPTFTNAIRTSTQNIVTKYAEGTL